MVDRIIKSGELLMNMKVLKKSKSKPKVGDIFIFQMKNENRYFFGRVICKDAKVGPFEELILIYIYKSFSEERNRIPELNKNNLLIPQLMTNGLPWTRGYFETISNQLIDKKDVFEKHCFRDIRGRFFDEYNNPYTEAFEPCGERGVNSFRTIDDKVSKSLGLPLSEE
jgi:hypothetical protein